MSNHAYWTKGITLIELMVTLAVLAILITIAAPSFQTLIKSNQVAGANNEIIAMMHLARSEAIRRNPFEDPVTMILSEATTNGWQGAVFAPGEQEAEECPADAIRCTNSRNVDLKQNLPITLRFDNRGYSVNEDGAPEKVELTLVHQDCQPNRRHARKITVLPGGQVSSEPIAGCQ